MLFNLSTQSFDCSGNFNLRSGKYFSIGGVEILNSTTLLSSVTSAPGLTSIGHQISLTAGTLNISNNMISATVTNQDLELNPNGTGNIVLVTRTISGTTVYPRIANVGFPVNLNDAVPKYYVTGAIQQSPIALTFIDNGLSGNINTNIILMLNDIAQASLYIDGKYAYVHVQHLGTGSPPTVTRYLKRFIIRNNAWVFDTDLTSSIW